MIARYVKGDATSAMKHFTRTYANEYEQQNDERLHRIEHRWSPYNYSTCDAEEATRLLIERVDTGNATSRTVVLLDATVYAGAPWDGEKGLGELDDLFSLADESLHEEFVGDNALGTFVHWDEKNVDGDPCPHAHLLVLPFDATGRFRVDEFDDAEERIERRLREKLAKSGLRTRFYMKSERVVAEAGDPADYSVFSVFRSCWAALLDEGYKLVEPDGEYIPAMQAIDACMLPGTFDAMKPAERSRLFATSPARLLEVVLLSNGMGSECISRFAEDPREVAECIDGIIRRNVDDYAPAFKYALMLRASKIEWVERIRDVFMCPMSEIIDKCYLRGGDQFAARLDALCRSEVREANSRAKSYKRQEVVRYLLSAALLGIQGVDFYDDLFGYPAVAALGQRGDSVGLPEVTPGGVAGRTGRQPEAMAVLTTAFFSPAKEQFVVDGLSASLHRTDREVIIGADYTSDHFVPRVDVGPGFLTSRLHAVVYNDAPEEATAEEAGECWFVRDTSSYGTAVVHSLDELEALFSDDGICTATKLLGSGATVDANSKQGARLTSGDFIVLGVYARGNVKLGDGSVLRIVGEDGSRRWEELRRVCAAVRFDSVMARDDSLRR
ncbi:Uncharacterised protein [Slackia heliotrinireducens]|uniref:Uncharacterized protein n=1 Tax=Slackia heliotrinireducens (strain ATCC 29202 / DSM 20476 / NCTC 11029 / RHS 1) TaxID=471855 RepID=C7N290_SLAHD|nr:hypothetical protein [Slackia heliotrinireducens]ACV21396.1 hypothetical protein Shel_03290 [Slackia heliotrinireducens DSM 20476]VEG98829.1 Uncharacterised protein [Slackia heliotrinireducens]